MACRSEVDVEWKIPANYHYGPWLSGALRSGHGKILSHSDRNMTGSSLRVPSTLKDTLHDDAKRNYKSNSVNLVNVIRDVVVDNGGNEILVGRSAKDVVHAEHGGVGLGDSDDACTIVGEDVASQRLRGKVVASKTPTHGIAHLFSDAIVPKELVLTTESSCPPQDVNRKRHKWKKEARKVGYSSICTSNSRITIKRKENVDLDGDIKQRRVMGDLTNSIGSTGVDSIPDGAH
ncbi:hypothetical protein TorRG33x02_008650 [Trema orientale]|uniref:Uncharacterized protein n=1 Tax=Trema orientale TaxID=63057 RepID=A0A2P5G0T5_TREOI|nr:hypothetical protein TorRG33x02_008650 [Trema orientale]